MANYLQRIVASGARTISPVRPPVSSHALIPPVAAPFSQPAPELAMRADEPAEPMLSRHEEASQVSEQPRVVQEHSAMPSPASPIHEPGMEYSPSVPPRVPALWPLTPIVPSPSERVRAPEGLRRARSNITPQQETIREAVKMPLKQKPQYAAESPEKLPPPMRIESDPVPAVIPEQAQSNSTHDKVQPLAVRMPIQQVEFPVADMNVTAEKPPALTPVKPKRAAAANADRKVEIPTPLETPKWPIETHPLEVRASAPRQTNSPPVSNIVDKRKQSKISIGRIDVQVNNQLPPQPAGPQMAKPVASSNFLDTRYLSRFFLRL